MSGIDLVGMLIFMGSLTGIAAIIGRAVVRYQDRKLRGPGDGRDQTLRAEVEELRAELAEQRDLRQRVLELEERVDFAERLLAQQRERRLPAAEG